MALVGVMMEEAEGAVVEDEEEWVGYIVKTRSSGWASGEETPGTGRRGGDRTLVLLD